MKNLYLILPIIILVSYGGCGDDGPFVCDSQLMRDRFADTDCIAEEFIIGCQNIFCRADRTNVVNISEQCLVIDCETLECERISVSTTTVLPGFMTDLFISENNGLPAGNFVVDEQENPFTCAFVSNQ